MRIISGKHKSRRLSAPKNLPVRPTKDMAKEGLFNILNNTYYFGDVKVLDLFAGTGNISFEFASRGALNVTAVDRDQGCVVFIEKASDDLELDIKVLKNDVFSYLDNSNETFDIIFADPIYEMDFEDFSKLVNTVFDKKMLLEEGVLVIEHSKRMSLESLPNYSNSRNYGGSVFSFFGVN